MIKPTLLVILGPTAAGKSALAVEIAKALNGEIISADSMQVYKGMNIGTAKLTENERQNIPHHLIDIKAPDEDWSVAEFMGQTKILITDILKRKKLPIIVGGTGLYIWSLLEGYSFPITKKSEIIRERLQKEAELKGNQYLLDKLKEIDPETAGRLHVNDLKRIIRALEVFEETGKPISELQDKNPLSEKYNIILIGLNLKREELYKKIEERVDKMLDDGLIKEVSELKKLGFTKDLPSMQALGYKEVMDYLDEKYEMEDMVALLKKRTRNFAKRQMTWFRRFQDIKWFEAGTSADKIISAVSLDPDR